MRTYKLLSLILVLGIGFSACYDEDAIHTTKGDIPYELKEGGDEVDQYIYKFYQENGSIIMVDYDTIDYQWNMSGLAKNVYLTKQEDRVVLMKGFSMLEKTFLNIYDTDFKKKYFPLKHKNWKYLADKETDERWWHYQIDPLETQEPPFEPSEHKVRDLNTESTLY